jgi:hypothetical protein
MLSIIGMTVSLIVNLIFIPVYAERATAYSQTIAECLVAFTSFFLAKKVLHIKFPLKKLLYNALCVLPFILITHLVTSFTSNNYIIVLICALACSIYFIFYQRYLMKERFLIELAAPYFIKGKNKFLA